VVTSLRDTASAAGIQRPLIWTESGAPSSQRYGGSPSMQAGYVVQAYAAAFGLGVGMMTWFPFQDFDNPTYFYFASHGLLGLDGTTKPSYAAYSVAASYLTAATALRAQDPASSADPAGPKDTLSRNPTAGGSSWPGPTASPRRKVGPRRTCAPCSTSMVSRRPTASSRGRR
jgi:hypothetical protein